MVAGNLKISYAKININVELALPTSIVGESFHVCGIADANKIIVPLKMAEDTFWVELMYVVNA
jgi:chemotaxis protein CheX